MIETTEDSAPEFNDASETFKDFMRGNLPVHVAEYLIACGYDREESFLMFEVNSGKQERLESITEVLRTQHDIIKEHFGEELTKVIYGRFYNIPERFTVLPGHADSIVNFAKGIQQLREGRLQKYSQRKLKRLRPSSHETFCIRDVDESSEGLSEGQNYNDSMCRTESDAVSCLPLLSDIPRFYSDLNSSILKYIRSNRDYSFVTEQQYDIQVYPATKNGFPTVGAYVSCKKCGTKLHLPYYKDNFRLSNFYRHIKCCLLNKPRKGTKKRKMHIGSSDFLDNPSEMSNEHPDGTQSDTHVEIEVVTEESEM